MNEKKKLISLAVLLVVAALVWYKANRAPSTAASSSLVAQSSYAPLAVENPELQRGKLEASRKTEYRSNGRDLFSEIVPPPVDLSAKKQSQVSPQPVTPPPPPPVMLPGNVKFFGYGTIPNGTAKRAFLINGDDIVIVAEGDTLYDRFRVVKIGNANLEFEEIASGRRNSISLEPQEGGSPSS
jgi:hypothetical protein